MNLADLETLLAVSREGSFSRAAETLRRTQPAISLAVRRLEEDCGERLLDRAGKQARLTAAGELVAARARQMLSQHERLEQELLELRGHYRGKVTIGANESTALFLLPVLEPFRRRHPGLKIEVRRGFSRLIPSQVLAGELDFGLVAYAPEQRELQAVEVYQDRLTCVVYPGHPLARAGKPVALARLGRESFIAHNVESPYRAYTVDTFRRRQVPLNIALEMPTIESIKYLVARGLGIAFIPRIAAERELAAGTLREVAIRQFKAERPLRLVLRRGGELSHAARAFYEAATASLPARSS